MNITLKTVNPDTPDSLRDAQQEADQRVVDDLRDKISKLEARLEEMKMENERLEAWLKSEKRTYRLQYFGPGGRM